MTDDDIITGILEREGSAYTNDPADRGGPTKYGITLETLARWRRAAVTDADVQQLTDGEARDIYRSLYVSGPGFDKLNSMLLRATVVDAGVNHGTESAVLMLQKALGVRQDGVLGPETIGAANRSDPKELALLFSAQRARKYGRIIEKDHSQAKYASGWMNRLAEFIEEAAVA